MGADPVHRAGVRQDDGRAIGADSFGSRLDQDAEQPVRSPEHEWLFFEPGALVAARVRRAWRRGLVHLGMNLAEPADDRVDHLLWNDGSMSDGGQELVSGEVPIDHMRLERSQAVEQRLLRGVVGCTDDQDVRGGPARQAQQIDIVQPGDRLAGEKEAQRFLSVGVLLGTGREALRLEHPMHLVGPDRLGGKARAIQEGMPQDDRRDIVALACDLGGDRCTEPQPHHGDRGRTAARAQLVDGGTDITMPLRDPIRITLGTRGVTGAVEVESEHGEPRDTQVLGEMAKGAMRSYVIVAERIAQQDGDPARVLGWSVNQPNNRELGSPK